MIQWFNEQSDVLIMAFAALAAVGAVLSMWFGLIERNPMSARIKNLSSRRATLRAEYLGETPAVEGKRRGFDLLKQLAELFKIDKREKVNTETVKFFLAEAGIRSRDAAAVYAFLRIVLTVAFAVVTFLYLSFSKYAGMPFGTKLLYVGIAAILGFYAPRIYLKNAAMKRKKKLRNQLPDALDLLVICAEAGLSLDSAVIRVVREMAQASPEITEELGLFSIELNFLPERSQAFSNLVGRTNMDEFRAIINTLSQAERYGTPLAQALRTLSAEFRNDRMIRAEEKAARLPAILTVPMMIFILPCLFIILLGPAILRVVDALSKF